MHGGAWGLAKYKSACLCTIEHPINELVQYVLSLTDGKNSWDVGRKYEKGKLVKYKSACLCTLEHPINELVRSNTTSALLDVEGEGEPTEYVLVLADIIKANDADRTGKDAYRSARNKYEKGKLDKYKSACLCTIEHAWGRSRQ